MLKVIQLIENEAPTPTKDRGRSANASTKSTPARKVVKRGKLGEGILRYLQSKGSAGAHVKDIAVAVKSKPANVTAWFYSTGTRTTKKVKPATFALAPKK
ncbi:MAG: hypothetical protein WDO13_18185 [Verrucomicrobiota bacterium]